MSKKKARQWTAATFGCVPLTVTPPLPTLLYAGHVASLVRCPSCEEWQVHYGFLTLCLNTACQYGSLAMNQYERSLS